VPAEGYGEDGAVSDDAPKMVVTRAVNGTFWQVCRCGAVFIGQGKTFDAARADAAAHRCEEKANG
jgi:hypothetical protein